MKHLLRGAVKQVLTRTSSLLYECLADFDLRKLSRFLVI